MVSTPASARSNKDGLRRPSVSLSQLWLVLMLQPPPVPRCAQRLRPALEGGARGLELDRSCGCRPRCNVIPRGVLDSSGTKRPTSRANAQMRGLLLNATSARVCLCSRTGWPLRSRSGQSCCRQRRSRRTRHPGRSSCPWRPARRPSMCAEPWRNGSVAVGCRRAPSRPPLIMAGTHRTLARPVAPAVYRISTDA